MATTPYPFVANAILTASQLNSTFNIPVSAKTASYVLTAADAGTRVTMSSASATTITVNTSLFAAGDNLEITNIGAGVCTVTAGTATVSTSGTLALVANAGGTLYFTSTGVSVFIASGVAATASAFTLVSATTIGTTVASVTVSSAFSATFDNYKVIISGGTVSVDDELLGMILGATTTGYNASYVGTNYASTSANNVINNSAASWTRIGALMTNGISANFDICSPFLAKITTINGSHMFVASARSYAGNLQNTTSYTAFTLTPASGTMTGGTIRVYGYANS